MLSMRRFQQVAIYATILLALAGLVWAVYNQQHGTTRHGMLTETEAALVEASIDRQQQHRNRSSNSVTPIIHQSWKTRQLPTNRTRRWSASWRTCFPDWEWRLWTDEDNLDLVREHYLWFLPVYLGYTRPVERADLARYFYLHRYGGIYADLDTICLRSFKQLLLAAEITFGGMDFPREDPVLGTYVQNSFMASRGPGHPFWLRVLRRIERNFHAGKRGRPEDVTGPNVMMEELREYVKSKATDVMVYPGKYFNPFSWWLNDKPPCKHMGLMSDAAEKACAAQFPKAYVLQLHSHSWGGGRL